jgi:glycosyltransferase 2 family protein
MTRSALTKCAKITISVLLLTVILWQLDAIADIGRVLAGAVPELLVLALLVMTADRVLMSFKWILLLQSRGLRLPLYRGFKIYCASMIWGMFLPTTVGADALRAYLTSRSGLDGYEVTASIIVERVVGFIAALLFGLIGLVLLSRAGVVDERFDVVWWAGGAALGLGLGLMLLSFSTGVFEAMLRLVPQRFRTARIVGRFRQFHGVYRGYGAERAVLGVFFALTLAEQALTVVGAWVIAIALHVDVSLWLMVGVMPLSMLIARLPITFDGLGLYEGVFTLLMGLGGVGVAESLSIALSGRVIQTLAWTPWWFLYSIGNKDVRPPKEAVHS